MTALALHYQYAVELCEQSKPFGGQCAFGFGEFAGEHGSLGRLHAGMAQGCESTR